MKMRCFTKIEYAKPCKATLIQSKQRGKTSHLWDNWSNIWWVYLSNTVFSRQEGPVFETPANRDGFFFFICLHVLPLCVSPTVQRPVSKHAKLTDDAKLAIDVNVSVNRCVSFSLSNLALVHNKMKVPKKWITSVSLELMQYLLVSLSCGKVIVRYWAADKQCITSTVFKETGLPSPHSSAKQEWINKWKQLHLLNSQELKRGQQNKLIQTNTKGNFSMMINY